MYRIIKVLNNNGILALNSDNGKETILLGKGVGFGRRTGERVASVRGARQYELVTDRYSALTQINSLDPVFIELTAKIMDEAEKLLGPMRHDILIPMADHIALAVRRAGEGTDLPNPFKQDIRALFSQEYQAAMKGKEIIREFTGIEIPDDEVGYITLHIHAGISQEKVAEALETARLVQEGIRMIRERTRIWLPEDSLGYNRLLSHMRYMIARTRSGERTDLDLEDYAKEHFPEEYEAARQVCRSLEEQMGMKMAREETGFLAIHIRRASQRE